MGALALALRHACRLKPMPCFILLEELEKLGLEALLWGQSGVLVSDRLGPCQSLRVLGPLQAGLLLFPSPCPPHPSFPLPLWQCFPVKGSGQMQRGPSGMFTQVPP